MAAQFKCSSAQLQQCEKLIKSYNCPTQSPEDLWKSLHEGILVEDNKAHHSMYFWLDENDRLGVEMFARALDVCWGEEQRYWTYGLDTIPIINKIVDVARLKDVCWLDVEAKFDTRLLTKETEYEAFFDIEMNRGGKGWNCIMKFQMEGPFGLKNKLEMRVDQLMGAGRIEIPVGKFEMPAKMVEEEGASLGKFKMYEHGGQWKDGLIVRGVIIKPVVYCKCSLFRTTNNVRKLSDVGKNKLRRI